MLQTGRYMAGAFAEELGGYMGCAPERNKLPPKEFVEDMLRPPPIYFETDEPAFQGVCCVCLKKGMSRQMPQSRMRSAYASGVRPAADSRR